MWRCFKRCFFWVVDVGGDPPAGEGPRGLPLLSGLSDGRHGT